MNKVEFLELDLDTLSWQIYYMKIDMNVRLRVSYLVWDRYDSI